MSRPVRHRGGEPVGLVAVPSSAREPDEDGLLRQLTESVAVTHENVQVFAEEHRIALTLQRSLLPSALPEFPGLQLIARYRASGRQTEVGGDFYDAFETPGDTVTVVIGDVQGHSLTAAVLMGELRYSLRAYAEDGHPPAEVLRRLNRLLLRHHRDITATVCIVQLGPDRSRATVTNAGHIPPLVLVGGRADYLGYGGPLLAALAANPDRDLIPVAHGAGPNGAFAGRHPSPNGALAGGRPGRWRSWIARRCSWIARRCAEGDRDRCHYSELLVSYPLTSMLVGVKIRVAVGDPGRYLG